MELARQIQQSLVSDSVLHQMKEDETSLPYVSLRIKELMSEGIAAQYELAIERQKIEIEQLRNEKDMLQENLTQAIEEIKDIDEQKLREEAKTELLSREINDLKMSQIESSKVFNESVK